MTLHPGHTEHDSGARAISSGRGQWHKPVNKWHTLPTDGTEQDPQYQLLMKMAVSVERKGSYGIGALME
jgi:hypothetical protein